MAGFIRRFTFDPGLEQITAIEGVIIIDREPPASLTGLGSGTVLVVGEFEDGPFAEPTEVFSGTDLQQVFGGFGYEYDGTLSNNPSARARKADGALTDEYWNGNGFISLVNKKFSRLIVCRVDTSVGEVEFTRLPALSGDDSFSWDLEPAQTLVLDLDGTVTTATFSAAAAQLNSAAGTFPSTFVGGETMNVTIDEGTAQQIGPIDIVFQDTDQAQADIINRINAVLGYVAATDQGGGVTRMTGRVRGASGSVRVNSVSAALVTTATGFSVSGAAGTGNVGNIDAVSLADVKSVVETAVAGTRVDRDSTGALRIAATSAAAIMVDPASTATALGFTTNLVSTEPDGYAMHTSGNGTYPTTFAGGETLTLGVDEEVNVTVVFQAGDQAKADVITRINAALGYTAAADAGGSRIKFTGRANGGQFRVVASTGAVSPLAQLGLTIETIDAVAHESSLIPAGTRVRNSAGVEWVTMVTTQVDADDEGPYAIPVRPATDDGSALGSVVGSLTVLPAAIPGAAFRATNTATIDAALSEAALDAAYSAAIDSTLSPSSIAREANVIFSARQSNVLRSKLRQNALAASSEGLRGRMAVIRPPLGTKRSVARSGVAQPGVGAYRSDRVVYAYPGAETFVPQIAQKGLSGGAGFTADGFIDTGFDSWVSSLLSQLPPENNPGESTDFMLAIVGLEKNNPDVQDMTMADYMAFKAAGIAALRIEEGKAIVQSGKTSVNPATQPNLQNINRRRMADFIQDTLASRLKAFSKKINTRLRRADVVGEIDAFMNGLLSPNAPASQRIDSYAIDAKSANTANTLAAGIFRIILKVRTLSTLDFIVLETVVGEGVQVTEQPLAA